MIHFVHAIVVVSTLVPPITQGSANLAVLLLRGRETVLGDTHDYSTRYEYLVYEIRERDSYEMITIRYVGCEFDPLNGWYSTLVAA